MPIYFWDGLLVTDIILYALFMSSTN